MADRQRSITDWRPSALMRELQMEYATGLMFESSDPPWAGTGRFGSVLSRLDELGIDSARYVDTYLLTLRAGAIATVAAMPILLGGTASEIETTELGLPDESRTWARLLTGDERSPREWFELAQKRGGEWSRSKFLSILAQSPRIESWLRSAGLDETARVPVPTPAEYAECETSMVSATAEERWIHERFMETYLDRWSYESLLLEWRYLHGEIPAPCHRDAMRTRHLDAADMARTISWRVAHDDGDHGGMRSMSAGSFVHAAAEHLAKGRFGAAAGLFDACRIAQPDDAEAHNNFGFCILPLDRPTALAALERAAELGWADPLNSANRVLALYLLGRPATALEVANNLVASSAWLAPRHGYLWSWESDPLGLLHNAEARSYVASLASTICIEAGDESGAAKWQHRFETLST